MPATVGLAVPISVWKVQSTQGAQAAVRRFLEKSGQNTPASTYLYPGTPVQIDVAGATGFLIACPAMTSVATAIIAGFSLEAGHNLTTSGVGTTLSQGTPVNQPNAIIIPGGAWPSDGTLGVAMAEQINQFMGILGNGSDNTLAVLAQNQLTVPYGLTQDATTKYWYVDTNKTNVAGGACVEIVDFVDPIGTLNGRVAFRVLNAAAQFAGKPSA